MPGEGGSLAIPAGFVMPELLELAHSAERTVILDVGGGRSYEAFASVLADPTERGTFVQNLTRFILEQGYDGASIDWEFPQTPGDGQNLSALMAELRASFDAADRDLQLSVAVSSNEKRGQWIDAEAITPKVDYYLVMTFGYYGPWSSESGHNAPLYPPPPQEGPSRCVDQSLRYWIETRGVPRSKILMGLPFFGLWFDSEDLYQAFTETRQADYRNIKPLVNSGYSYHWDDSSQVPYLIHDDSPGVWSYDDPHSVAIKVDYVLSNGLGGVAIWDLTMDLVAGEHELLKAIAHKLMAHQAYLPLVRRAE
jgi:chitinase